MVGDGVLFLAVLFEGIPVIGDVLFLAVLFEGEKEVGKGEKSVIYQYCTYKGTQPSTFITTKAKMPRWAKRE